MCAPTQMTEVLCRCCADPARWPNPGSVLPSINRTKRDPAVTSRYFSLVLILFTCLNAGVANALDDRAARVDELCPLIESGIVNDEGAAMALIFKPETFRTLVTVGKAMRFTLIHLGFTHVDQTIGNGEAQDRLRITARAVMRARLPYPEGSAGDAQLDRTLADLRDRCGMLIIPLRPSDGSRRKICFRRDPPPH